MIEEERQNGKPRVLLVEDNRAVRVMTKMALSRDFDVHEAADGNQAREHLDSGKEFHAVLTDISYPDGGAESLLAHMRDHSFEPHRNVPLILMTAGHNQDMENLKALEEKRGRSVDTIAKPFSPLTLIELVKTAVKKGQKLQ